MVSVAKLELKYRFGPWRDLMSMLTEIRMNLRPALPSDLDLLRCWGQQAHVIAAISNDGWAWEVELHRNPAWREQLIAEIDGSPIGFIQIIDPAHEETRYWGDAPEGLRAIDIWIGEGSNLGKGYGTIMMNLALDRCFSEPNVSAVLIDPLASNTRAHRFYERLGFQFVERRWFGVDECRVYRMRRGELAPIARQGITVDGQPPTRLDRNSN